MHGIIKRIRRLPGMVSRRLFALFFCPAAKASVRMTIVKTLIPI